MMRRQIDLSIGSLVLYGCCSSDRNICGDAFVTELDRLLSKDGLPDTVNTRIGALHLPPAASQSPTDLGRALARAIFLALSSEVGKEER